MPINLMTGEMYRFVERHRLPKLTQTDNLRKPIAIKDIEFIFNNLPQRKLQA